MTDDLSKLSDVKRLILKFLSENEYVSSKTLLEATQQKYFDRRIRELRDELGYDIETFFNNGEQSYRLRSLERNEPKPRSYLPPSDKKELLANSNNTCSLCGKQFNESRKSVFDHRKPLIKGGIGLKSNYQIICNECNNQKRTQCKNCDLDCDNCYLAFPEKFPPGIVLRPTDHDFWEKVNNNAKNNNLTLEDYIFGVLKRNLD
jgi:5-methylcytosine-specific restriction endonuclease McrA